MGVGNYTKAQGGELPSDHTPSADYGQGISRKIGFRTKQETSTGQDVWPGENVKGIMHWLSSMVKTLGAEARCCRPPETKWEASTRAKGLRFLEIVKETVTLGYRPVTFPVSYLLVTHGGFVELRVSLRMMNGDLDISVPS